MTEAPEAAAATPTRDAARPAPAPGLALASALHALIFAGASVVVPTTLGSWLPLTLLPLALLHAAVAVLSLTRRQDALRMTWAAASVYGLLWLFGVSWMVVSLCFYLGQIYQSMGRAVAGGLLMAWAVIALLTLPISLWGLAVTRPRALLRRRAVASLLALIVAALAGSYSLRAWARADPVASSSHQEVTQLLSELAREHAGTPPGVKPTSLLQTTPARCEAPLEGPGLTLLLTSVDHAGQAFSSCLQAGTPRALDDRLRALIAERVPSHAALSLDLVRGVQRIPRTDSVLDALSVRPGLDGLCGQGRCLASWQLVALDQYTQYRPLDSVRDASFGVDLARLARALGVEQSSTLLRVETTSWLLDRGALTPLVRQRPPRPAVDASSLDQAIESAARHILRAQYPEGAFRYLLNPFTGQSDDRTLSLRRQAGTLFALCELLPREQVTVAARRALDQLRSYERHVRDMAMLTDRPHVADIGPTALPLIAFAACRDAVGPAHDTLIGGMARFLMALQRDDGSFRPRLELATGIIGGEHESLYASGQALLALVLVEQLAMRGDVPGLPERDALASAIERGMTHYGESYWPKPLRSLFFLEENWHCLAARAALSSHRHDGYERFCLDYTRFKRRLILDAGRGNSPENVGGYSISDMFPPHAAVTAGFGEVLSAAIEIQQARGLDVREDRELMQEVLGFLLSQQWTLENCFGCGTPDVVGGFSESASSPAIRIDYVQHTMAALAHGKRALGLR